MTTNVPVTTPAPAKGMNDTADSEKRALDILRDESPDTSSGDDDNVEVPNETDEISEDTSESETTEEASEEDISEQPEELSEGEPEAEIQDGELTVSGKAAYDKLKATHPEILKE